VSAGSITDPTGEALSADVVRDRAFPQFSAGRNVHRSTASLGAAVRERIHAFNLLHRQQAAQRERNTLYRLASPVRRVAGRQPTRFGVLH
jgi:hypothetical protein